MLRITLIGIGRLKGGAERELADRYLDRARQAGRAVGLVFEGIEIDESRARRAEDRKIEEAKAIGARLEPGSHLIVLDETGSAMDSARFAATIGQARDGGASHLALVIGGPDGLDPAWRSTATHVVAFGAMTWPHQLVRAMASEQLYRAVTILAGHPYHRV